MNPTKSDKITEAKIVITKEKPRSKTKFEKFLAHFSPRNVRGLLVLFGCVIGAILLVVGPLIAEPPVISEGNHKKIPIPQPVLPKPPFVPPEELPKATTVRFSLAHEVTVYVGSKSGQVIWIDTEEAIVSYSVSCLFGISEEPVAEVELSPFRIRGLNEGFGVLTVVVNVLRGENIIQVTRTAQITVMRPTSEEGIVGRY